MNRKASGTRKERELIKLLEADGFECTRSGASLGRYDVIALKRNDDHPHSLWIQVKYGTRKYIDRCVKQWFQDSMPPYHHEILYCYIRNDGWYELVMRSSSVELIKRFRCNPIRTCKKGVKENGRTIH